MTPTFRRASMFDLLLGVSPFATGSPNRAEPVTTRSARYAGPSGSLNYRLCVPQRSSREPIPLLLVLHGCGQPAPQLARSTQWDVLAARQNFVVAYPEQSIRHNGQRCWNWFEERHQRRGDGEPAMIAGLISHLAGGAAGRTIDAERVYLIGFSAGGAMALNLAASYPELIAAVAVHSTPPLGSASGAASALRAMAGHGASASYEREQPIVLPPMISFQGSADRTVAASNGSQLSAQWRRLHERRVQGQGPRRITREQTTTSLRRGRVVTLSRWHSADGRNRLESWRVEGLGHAWSGGARGLRYSDPEGPRATAEMWRFVAQHRLGR